MDFLEGQDFDPTLIRRIFSQISAKKTRDLNHSAILASKILLALAMVTTGRDLSTDRPAYGFP